jgi:hypothetical protein
MKDFHPLTYPERVALLEDNSIVFTWINPILELSEERALYVNHYLRDHYLIIYCNSYLRNSNNVRLILRVIKCDNNDTEYNKLTTIGVDDCNYSFHNYTRHTRQNEIKDI